MIEKLLGGVVMRKQGIKKCLLTIILVIFVVYGFPYRLKSNEMPRETFKENVKETIEVTYDAIKYEKDYVDVDIKIPVIKNLKDYKIQDEINRNFKKRAIDFKNDIENMAKDYKSECDKQGEECIKFVANSDYEVTYNNKGILSIPVIYYQYTGGAHGVYSKKTYNINLNTGEEIKIKSLFKENYNYKDIINNTIKEEINKNSKLYFKESFSSIDEHQDFYINEKGIVVYFQLYEIAPYSSGIPEFQIPFSKIKTGLNIDLVNDNPNSNN